MAFTDLLVSLAMLTTVLFWPVLMYTIHVYMKFKQMADKVDQLRHELQEQRHEQQDGSTPTRKSTSSEKQYKKETVRARIEVFTTMSGECFHEDRDCRALRSSHKITTLRSCTLCGRAALTSMNT